MIELYGIPNCDTVKKAQVFLKEHNLPYTFHNYKTEGIGKTKVKQWFKKWGWETVLNKKSTTWKNIDEEARIAIDSERKAIDFLVENTSAIKRPVLEKDGVMMIGFSVKEYEELLPVD